MQLLRLLDLHPQGRPTLGHSRQQPLKVGDRYSNVRLRKFVSRRLNYPQLLEPVPLAEALTATRELKGFRKLSATHKLQKCTLPERFCHLLPKDDDGSSLLDILWSYAVCNFIGCVATVGGGGRERETSERHQATRPQQLLPQIYLAPRARHTTQGCG